MPETKEEIFQTSEATPLEIPASLINMKMKVVQNF